MDYKDMNAIDKVKQMVADGKVSQEVAEEYFPELKEVVDGEKIRKHLITIFTNDFGENSSTRFGGIKVKDIIAWLKKGGEQKPAWSERYIADVFEKVGLAKIVREQANDNLTNALQSTMIELAKFMPQQKPWSEEDEKKLNTTIAYLLDVKDFKLNAEKCIDWLKELKDRFCCKANCTTTWKPSGEQMAYLAAAIEESNENAILKSLYQDLMKLRDE